MTRALLVIDVQESFRARPLWRARYALAGRFAAIASIAGLTAEMGRRAQ